MDLNTALLDEIRTLIDEPPADAPEPLLARIEDTLTAGYAQALAIEAERWRLERKLGEVVELAAAGSAPPADLAVLAQRMTAANADLTRLRALLASLRERASQLRTP